jgi:type IV pilus assembly protein PilA
VNIFCSKCGQAKEVEESSAGAIVTCAHCGNRFSVGGQAPQGAKATNTVLIVIAAVAFVPVVVAIIGIVAAIAIPNYIRFQSRSKQAECRTNLKALEVAARASFAEHHQYTSQLSELGFNPERGNRYAYFAGPGTQEDRSKAVAVRNPTDTQVGVDVFRFKSAAITERDLPAKVAGDVVPGVSGTCPDCSFVAVCLGTVDNDDTLDVWSISTDVRSGSHGELIPAGTPFNDLNDVSE